MISAFAITLGLAMLASSQTPVDSRLEELEAQLASMPEDVFGATNAPAYETFLSLDPTMVPDHLLLAVLLAGGTSRSSVDVARDLLHQAGDLTKIEQPSIYENIPGLGRAGLARMLASRELARRRDYLISSRKGTQINSPQRAFEVARTISTGPYEWLGAIYLDRRLRVLGTRILSRGSAAHTIVDPQQVFRPALELGASYLILVHQHPSGDINPSEQDEQVTARVARAGSELGIALFDHLVVAGNRFTSMQELGLVPQYSSQKFTTAYGYRGPLRVRRWAHSSNMGTDRVSSTATGRGNKFHSFGYGETSLSRVPLHNLHGGLAGMRGDPPSWRHPLPSATIEGQDWELDADLDVWL